MTNIEKYKQFCTLHPDIPVFSQPWWLDIVCQNQWNVIIIEKSNIIIATFPYMYRTGKFGLKYIGMPLLTQKLGPYIVYNTNKQTENKKISFEHDVYNQIIEKLPNNDLFQINFDCKYKNWLPFYWQNFSQTTRYTYRLNYIKKLDVIFSEYAINKRQKIKKAQNTLQVNYDLDLDKFYDYFSEVIKERNEFVSFSRQVFKNICNAALEHNQGKIFYCIDTKNNIHAINFTIWDREAAYYLIAMRKKEYNTSGGTEFLLHETIKYVSQFVDTFDFEGSMIKGVEESFRYYGASQTEYYSISKCNNRLLRLYKALLSF